MPSRHQGGKLIRTVAMKIFVEKTEGSNVMSLRKQPKTRCLVRIDYITDPSLDFVKNLEMYSRGSRPYMVKVFNSWANNRKKIS